MPNIHSLQVNSFIQQLQTDAVKLSTALNPIDDSYLKIYELGEIRAVLLAITESLTHQAAILSFLLSNNE